MLSADQALACNATPNPPPPSVADVTINGQTFGPSNPFSLGQNGDVGCDGADEPDAGENGGPGVAGVPGPTFTANISGVTIVGDGSTFITTLAPVLAAGGNGGRGGTSGAFSNSSVIPGDGAVGGAGGNVTLSFGGTISRQSPGDVVFDGLFVNASGGIGGKGGDAGFGGIFIHAGGNSAAGGNGGSINATITGGALTGLAPAVFVADGGRGGVGGTAFTDFATAQVDGSAGSAGGSGGNASVTFAPGVTIDSGPSVLVTANGGNGGSGGDAGPAPLALLPLSGVGGDGGAGAAGGTATLNFAGTASFAVAPTDDRNAAVLEVNAIGGDGGGGGTVDASANQAAGSGGVGGNGGTATLNFTGMATMTADSVFAYSIGQALLAQAGGGVGGFGATSNGLTGFGGDGGEAGNGGTADITVGSATSRATVYTAGEFLHGAVAQSIGGGGGNGGSGVGFFESGGVGAKGGDGGNASVAVPNALIETVDDASTAIIVQSIGGGGGIGGDSRNFALGANLSIGGNGGFGGNGAAASVTVGAGSVVASTSVQGGGGVLAQSIGGAGGAGGIASSKGLGFFSMTVGGDAGAGGSGGSVTIASDGLITTFGDRAMGLVSQSVGGGGGNGGVAVSTVGGIVPTVAVSVGGKGAVGGTAGAATVGSTGQINTYGPDAFGMLAQSVGGGGGNGGAAAATAIDVSPSDDVPAVSVSFAAGGAGGSANTGGTATVTNSGTITTAGHGAYGAAAQSVGGGGGTAGDASASSYTEGSDDLNVNVDVSVAIGGNGGTGGLGGTVQAASSGLIYTVGQDAFGLFGQSVGGSGGAGGAGDSSSTAINGGGNLGVSVQVGGTGGTGGHGGMVTVGNTGNIATLGDNSDGAFAQSVGGGGGFANGGAASNSAGRLGLAVGVGGNGGAGGDGGAVGATNGGLISTQGTGSMGLAGQSVGGGGGRAGKAGATSGGADTDLPMFVFDQVTTGFGAPDSVQKIGDQIFLFKDRIDGDVNTVEKLIAKFQGQKKIAGKPISFSPDLDVSVAVGGKGGAAGNGGAVTLTNTGQIATLGASADGIAAQSVGGGGGIGGGASATGASSDDTRFEFAMAVGGAGGAAGSGGTVSLTNTGLVETSGVLSYGMVGQSIGGGGGNGGSSGDSNTSALSFGVSLGGSGGAQGDGGSVTISSSGSVTTFGKNAVGIFAQSLGGGGGLIRTFSQDQQGDQSASTTSDAPDTHNVFLDVGVTGASGSTGSGSKTVVELTSGATLSTSGRYSHGVVALSFGGGGGAVGGGVINVIKRDATTGASSGDGGDVEIDLTGAKLDVSGVGSVGLWAASIGGGGVALLTDATAPTANTGNSTGNSGNVTINIDGSSVTSSNGTALILAQSTAGGGMMSAYGEDIDDAVGPYVGFNQAGSAGNVAVNVTNGSTLVARGAPAISAGITQGDAAAAGTVSVQIDASSSVMNNSEGFATVNVYSNASAQSVTNSGTITNTGPSGYAISGEGVTIVNHGTITGNIRASLDGTTARQSSVRNGPTGTIAASTDINLGPSGTMTNDGTVEVGGAGKINRTVLTGSLIQSETGRLKFDLDTQSGLSDYLSVTGTATLQGALEVQTALLSRGSYDILDAGGGLDAGSLSGSTRQVFSFTPVAQGNRLSVALDADFASFTGATSEQYGVSGALQSIWDAGAAGFGDEFAALALLEGRDSYAAALDQMLGQSVAAIGYARLIASSTLVQSTYSCPLFVNGSAHRSEGSCMWLNVNSGRLDRDATTADPGFELSSVTTSLGGQIRIDDSLFLGGALGWESSDLEDDTNRTSVDGDSLLGAISVKSTTGPWTLTGAFDLGFGSFTSVRQIDFGGISRTADGAPDSFNAGIHGKVAYLIERQSMYLEPALDVDLNFIRLDGYTESGAGDLNLAVQDTDTLVFTGTPSLRIGHRIDLDDGGVLDAYLKLGASFSSGEDFTTTAGFADYPGAARFQTTIDNPNLVARLTAGVDVYSADNLQLRVEYAGSYAENQTQHGAQLRLRYDF